MLDNLSLSLCSGNIIAWSSFQGGNSNIRLKSRGLYHNTAILMRVMVWRNKAQSLTETHASQTPDCTSVYASRCHWIIHALLESASKCINKLFPFFIVQVYLLENTLETVDQAGYIPQALGIYVYMSPCLWGRHSLPLLPFSRLSRKYSEVRRNGDNCSYSLPAGHSNQTHMKNQEASRAKRIQVCLVQVNSLTEYQLLTLPIDH